MKPTLRRCTLALLMIASLSSSYAQYNVSMVNGQTVQIDGCQHPTGTIYDDGGPNGNYSNYFDGYVVITVPPGVTVTLAGSYDLESCCDYITVWDGGISGTQLWSSGGSGSLSLTASSGIMTIRLGTDYSVTYGGFALSYTCGGVGSDCLNAPTDVVVGGITTTSAQVGWNATNTAGPFLVNLNGSVQTTNTNSLLLTGLNVNTHYDLAISSVADNWTPCCTAHQSFRTACGTMDPPMQESFDDYGVGYNILPACWTKLLNYDDTLNEPQIVGSPYGTPPGALRMYCGSNDDGNHYSMVIGPRMNVADIATMSLRLSLRAPYSGTYLIVGVCDSTTRTTNNFTPVDTLTIDTPNQWETKLVDLSSYSGTGKYIALRMQRSLQWGNGYHMFVDDVALLPCGIWHERLYNPTYNSMWLSFDTIGSPVVDIEYGPEGFVDGGGTTVSGVTSPYRLTGLAPSTTYDVRIHPHCGSVADQTHSLWLSTLGAVRNQLNICEDFDSGIMPSDWLRTMTIDNDPLISTSQHFSGGHSLQMRSYYYGGYRTMVVLPPVDTVAIASLTINFKMNATSANCYIEVGVTEYPLDAADFVAVDTVWCDRVNEWYSFSVPLAAYGGSGHYIALRCYSPNWNEYAYIDNIEVAQCALQNVQITDITNRSVHITWDTVSADWPGSSATIEYGGTGFAFGTGTSVTVSPTAGSATITGLEADSTYDFVIYGNCDTMMQTCGLNRYSAHTIDRQMAPPYCEDFEPYADNGYPYSWSRPMIYDSRPRITTYRAHSGTKSLNLYSYSYYNNYAMAVLPLIETDDIRDLYISFWYNGSTTGSTSDYYLEVGVAESPSDPASFVTVSRIPMVDNRWQLANTDLSSYTGTGRYIAFRLVGTWGVECWIDDISITTCQVRDLTERALTSHSVTLSWTLVGSGSGATIEYGPHGFLPGSGTSVTITGGSYTIDGMESDSTYDYIIWGSCTDDNGHCPYNRFSFHTLPVPTAPTWCENLDSYADNSLPNGMYRPLVYDNLPRITYEGNPANCVTFRAYKYDHYDSGYCMFALPYLEEGDLTDLTLNFDLRQAYGDAQSRLTIGMMTDPFDTSTFVAIADTNTNHTGWQRYSIPLSGYSGTGRYIAFFYHYLPPLMGWYNNYAYIDNITIERCNVVDVHIYSVTAHDAWVSWNESGNVDSVEVEYGDAVTTTVTNAVSPMHLDGLTAGGTYRVYVRAHCHNSAKVCSTTDYTFTTRTDSLVAGYCEGFDPMPYNQMPQQWTRIQAYGSHPVVIDHWSDEYHTSPNRSIEFYTCSGADEKNFIVMPAAETSVAGGAVSFNLRCSNSDVRNRALMTVGVMTIPYDSTTFVPIATVRPTYQWQRYTIDLGGYTGTGRHIAFRYRSLDGCFYSYMDDLGFSLCRAGDLRATDITDQSVRLTWRQYGTHDASVHYTVEYGPHGFTRGTGTFVYTSDTSIVVGGLTNDSGYQFYVWSSCQDSSYCQQEEVAVHTLEEPLYTPYCTTFDNNDSWVLPADWSRPYGDIYPRVSTDRYRSSNRSLQFYTYSCNNWSDQTSMAVMPMVGVGNVSDLQLDFYFYNENSQCWLEIGVMSDPHDTNTFTLLHSVRTGGTYSWTRVRRSLAAYTGTGRYIAFRYRTSYCNSGYAYIDDLTLRTCAITSCRLANLGQDGVDVVWNATVSTPGVWMTYGVSGGSQSAPAYYTTSPIHISGLAQGTGFVVHLWPQCDSVMDNCNQETLQEETLHTWVDIPYCTGFDGLANNGFPNNWRRHSTVGANYPATSSSVRHSESYSLRFYADDTLFSQAAMPTINPNNECLATSSLFVTFWTYFGGNTPQGRLVVGVISDILDTNSFVGVDTISATTSTWEHHTVSLASYTGTGHFVAFRFLSDNGWWCECYVDDLCVEKCVAADLAISDITQNSVTVSWTGYGTNGIVVEYGPRGFAHGHGIFDTMTSSPYTITGLTELTEYEFNFISLCQCNMTGATYLPGGGSGGSGGGGGGSGGGGSGGGGGWGGGVDIIITTQANYLNIPYCEPFEDYDTMSFVPSYRRITGSSHLYPTLTHSNHHSGEGCVAMYTTTDTACYMSLPPLQEGTIADMVMTFYAYSVNNYATYTDVLHVGVMTNPDDPSTYTEVSAFRLSAAASWQQLSVDFAPYTGVGQYITFRFKPIYGSYTYYVDDIYVGRCGVTDVQFATTPNSVQVSWTAIHSPDAVSIQYGRQGFADDSTYTPTTVTATSSPYTVTGIDPDSNYDFFVMAQCSDTDFALCAPVAYTLNPMLYTPYCEDFEGVPIDALPEHWTVRQRYDNPRVQAHQGRQALYFHPYAWGNYHEVVQLKPLANGDSLNGKKVSFVMWDDYHWAGAVDFGVLTDTSDANSFVTMATVSNTASSVWEGHSVTLSGYSGPANRLAIRARSSSGSDWIWIDDLVVSNYATPQNVRTTETGCSQKDIYWDNTAGNAYYIIEYGPRYFDQWTRVPSDSCHVLLTGLSSSTEYEFHFVSPDGEVCCHPFTFTTLAAVPLPYCDNFDSYPDVSVPTGWHRVTNYGGYPRAHTYRSRSYPNSLDFYSCNGSGTVECLSMPDFDIDSIRHASLSCYMWCNEGNGNYIVVGVMDNPGEMSTFVAVDTLWPGSPNMWHRHVVSFAAYGGSGRFIAFSFANQDNCRALYIDDLVVSGCPIPDITVAGARQVRAHVRGNGTGVADYYIEYGVGMFEQGQQDTLWDDGHTSFTLRPHGTVAHVTTDPFYITGLEPGTQYGFYVRCSDTVPACGQAYTLTTAEEVLPPYCDDFGSCPAGQMPTGWSRFAVCHGDYPQRNGNGHIQFYQSNCTRPNSFAVMPDVGADSLRGLELYFNFYTEREQFYMLVGVMDDPDDTATFVPVDTVRSDVAGTWVARHVSLAGYRGSGRFIAFAMVNTTWDWNSMYIDDLFVNSYPTPMIGLTDATTIRILSDWEGEKDYWVEYGPEGFSQGDSTATWLHVTTDTVYITGLDQLAVYDVYHHPDSGGTTCFPRHRVATSLVLTTPYCDDFASCPSGQMPTGWSRFASCHADYPQRNGNGHIQFYQNNCVTPNSYAVMPDLDADSVQEVELYFNFYCEHSLFYMVVGVMDDRDNIATFTPVDTVWTDAPHTWQPKHVSMAGYRGSGRFIAFAMVNTTWDWSSMYIDDLYVQTCPRPHVYLSAATTVSAVVGPPHAADYWLEYGPQGMTPGDTANRLAHVTTDTFLVTGLDEHTTYDFYARCDSAFAPCDIRTASVTTSVLRPLCYYEDFEGYGDYANLTYWRHHGNYSNYPRTYSGFRYDGYYSLDHYGGYDTYEYSVLPDVGIDSIRHASLACMFYRNSTAVGLEVGVMTDPDDLGSFEVVDTMTGPVDAWVPRSVSFESYRGGGRFIAMRFFNTAGDWRSVLVDNLVVDVCGIPASVTASLNRHNTVRIHWDEQEEADPFWVEYGPAGFAPGTGSLLLCDSNNTDIVLANNSTYDFYFMCDSAQGSCRPKQTVSTMSPPLPLPLCVDFDTCRNSYMPYRWHSLFAPGNNYTECHVHNGVSHTSDRSLYFFTYYPDYHPYAVLPDLQADSLSQLAVSFWMRNDNYGAMVLELGVMSDPYDAGSFITIKRFTNTQNNTWQRMQAVLDDAPADAHFIAFRLTKTDYSWTSLSIDDLHIAFCGAGDLRVAELASDHIMLDWRQVGEPLVSIQYGPVGFATGAGTTVYPAGHPYTVSGLDNLTNYEFRFNAFCDLTSADFCNTNYRDTVTLFTPAGGTGCIDPTNLTAEYTTCTYGSYSNPRSNMGMLDYGCQSALSRHTVHYDTTERDPRTGGLLRTVPQGAEGSVRLGNWTSSTSNPEAESITYSLFVDPASFDLLILKYAAVLQDPEHSASQQPRFSIEILDEENNLIDSRCGAADFIANAALGWNEAANDVLWKDWTTVGLDMSAYANQTVRIRLTTYDCGEGSHYGYAYFTLGCLLKNILAEHCGDVAANTYTMPDGFSYSWYTDTVNKTTLYNTQTVTIPTANTTYYCDLSFVDDASCYFTMSAYAGTRYPLALFDSVVTVGDCRFYVQFDNRSTISNDGVTPIGTGEGCEAAYWDFGNGMTSTDYNGSTVYNTPGTYQVMLVSYIGGGTCADTIIKTLVLEYPSATPVLVGPVERCQNDDADTLTIRNATFCRWWSADTGTFVVVAPAADTGYWCVVTNEDGCVDTLTHNIVVHPAYDISDTVALCAAQLPYTWHDTTLSAGTTTGVYLLPRSSAYGCDSLNRLDLTVNYPGSGDTTASVCDSLVWYGTTYTVTPDTDPTHLLTDRHGCDSLLTLHLTVRHSSNILSYDTVFENSLPYYYQGHQLTGDTTVGVVLANAEGCDSVVGFHLHVIWNNHTAVDSTVCDNSLPLTWNHRTFAAAGTQYDTLASSSGSDSLLTMTLHVLPTYHLDFYDTICSNQSLTFDGAAYTAAGLYTDSLRTLTTPACDSLRTLHLTVYDTSTSDTTVVACDRFVWHGTEYSASSSVLSHTAFGGNAHGCDSLEYLHLTVNYSDTTHVGLTSCDSLTLGDTLTVYSDTTLVRICQNRLGCDSVVVVHVGIIRTPVLTHSGDQTILPGDTVRLYAAGAEYFVWTDGGGILTSGDTLAAAPAATTTYHIHAFNRGGSTIFNGDFEAGDTGFSSGYICSTDLMLEGRYVVGTNPRNHHPSFTIFPDHTTGGGNMMIVNGSGTPGTTVWSQTVPVAPNTNYAFETWAATVSPGGNAAVLQFDVNGVQLGMPFAVQDATYQWRRFYEVWNSGSDTIATITILNQNTALGGNDFAIDDISFSDLSSCPVEDSVTVTVGTVCDTVICDNMIPFGWNDVTFYSAGTQVDTLSTPDGRDSVVSMRVVVNPTHSILVKDTVCDNQSYVFYDSLLTTTGVYSHMQTNMYQCDSLTTLDFVVLPTYNLEYYDTTCDNQPVLFDGAAYSMTGDFTDSLHTLVPLQCDSVRTLHLVVYGTSSSIYYDTCTENQLPRSFHSITAYGDTADAMLTIANAAGCDSTIAYNLFVIWNNHVMLDSTVCDNQLPLTWNHRTFNSAGVQHDTLSTSLGSDSLLTMTLHVLPTYNLDFVGTICSNQMLAFDGSIYTATGDYVDSLHTLTSPACDSVRTLHLTVFETGWGDTVVTACDQFVWYDSTYFQSATDTLSGALTTVQGCDSTAVLHLTVNYSTSAVYYDTCTESQLPRTYHSLTVYGDTAGAVLSIANAAGCDSVVTYHLHVIWNNYSTLDSTVCDNSLPLTWNHRTFVSADTLRDTLPNSFGSDSIITMRLHVLPTYQLDFYDTICSNQSLTFDGADYTAAGLYTDSLHTLTTPACDSLRTLHLAVFDTTVGDTTAVACDSFTWHGVEYTASSSGSSYTSVGGNAHGCDSTIRLNLTVHYSDLTADADTICPNSLTGGYTWRDTLLYAGTVTGSYTITRPNQWGCDSVMTLSLVVHDNTTGNVYDTIVENQAATWQFNGVAVTDDTTQMLVTLTNQWGCDSIVSYNLFIWRNSVTMADSTICADAVGSFLWQGNAYADTLWHTFTDIHGADSTVVLRMSTTPTYDIHLYDTTCDNLPVTFADTLCGETGDYVGHFLTSGSCDSTVTLHLVVNSTYDYHFYDTIYHGDEVVFDGRTYSEPGDYTHQYTSSQGCDSVLTLHLKDITLVEVLRADSICAGDSLYFAGMVLTQSGVYRDTLAAENSLMGDTVVVLTLTVLDYPTVMFDTSHVCAPSPFYTLGVRTDAPYVQWTSSPFDETIDGHENDSILFVNPQETTTYHLFADYRDVPQCPSSDSITLIPIEPIEAAVNVVPDYLTFDRRHLEARNVGSGHCHYVGWTVQYYGEDAPSPLSDTSKVLRTDVPLGVDSVMITLVASNLTCADTDSVMVPVFVSGIYFPNVFTPAQETNGTFTCIGVGIAQFEIWIFDRRGDLVFHSTDISEGWDGTHDGRPCQQAAYVYRCHYTTQLEPRSLQSKVGTVTLLR